MHKTRGVTIQYHGDMISRGKNPWQIIGGKQGH